MKPLFSHKTVFCLSVLFYLIFPVPGKADDTKEEPRLPLAMEVFLKKPKDRLYEIHIHLTNVSSDPVTVNVHELPWTPPMDSTWLLAYRLDSNKSPIRQTVWRGKFGSRQVRLLPGESIQDKLALNPRMPTLLHDIQEFGVQLEWECPPPSLRFECKTGFPNTIMIPKNDPGLADTYAIDIDACFKLEKSIALISVHKDHDVLFLLTSEERMNDVKRIGNLLVQVDDYVRQCKPMWTNSWAVSFFTEKRFAGFLRDDENKHHFEKGLWQQANIGQYSSQIRTLFRYPWIRKKASTVYLSVYQLREDRH